MSDTDVTRATGDTLRAIADWVDAHPGSEPSQISLYTTPIQVNLFHHGDAASLADLLRALGGRWDKHAYDSVGQIEFQQEILPGVRYEVVASRDAVCERVKTGETVIHEPDADAVAALPLVERVVETFEWRCEPILAAKAAA